MRDDNDIPVLVGGVGEINFGKQYRQGNRVYDSSAVGMCLNAQPVGNAGGYSYLYLVDENKPEGERHMTNINEVFEAKPFNYVSLFSGVGGFEQALNNLGGNCVLASEIDKFANQSYEILYGHPTAGDITKIAAEDVPDHGVLVGGFPCQAFSVAGKRLGFDDTRGTLFFEIARLAKVKQPKVMLLENVKGLVGHDGGKTLDTIVQTLNDIGYTVDFNVLNSKYFGVPQNRERIFIIAVRDDLIEHSEWIIEGNNVVAKGKKRISTLDGVKTFNFDWPAQKEVTTRLRDILEDSVDERFYLSEEKTAKLVAQLNELGLKETDGIDVVGNLKPPQCTRLGQRDDVWSANGVAGTINATDYKQPRPIAEEQPKINIIGTTLNTGAQGTNCRHWVHEADEGLVGALSATEYKQPKQLFGETTKYRIRKLTPRECFRLQGFPDSEFDKLTANGVSNSQLYKQAGNAVTVNVISAIGKRLLPYL